MMPLGVPVDPEVYRMKSGCSAPTQRGSHSGFFVGIRSFHSTSRLISYSMGITSCPRRSSTIMLRTINGGIPFSGAILQASFAMSYRLIGLLPRMTPSQVMTTNARASTRRSASALAEKPPKTTVCTAPIRAHASIASGSSGTMGMKSATRSAGCTPRDFSAFAMRQTSSRASAYVYVWGCGAVSFSSGSFRSAMKAMRSPCPAATCRSSAL
mmetsp:Transcript_5521/g.16323  ORF Transcript_5521/g.16323 Transcript_5521/m.16323 type:complete len:212 (+) Transcript_5521:1103-1738(+)